MPASAKARRTQTPKKQTKLSAASFTANAKPVKPVKTNTSILSFFKKTEKPEDSLFIGEAGTANGANGEPEDDLYGVDEESRFNEVSSPVKRRRIRVDNCEDTKKANCKDEESDATVASNVAVSKRKVRPKGPFIMDSDSEGDEDEDEVKDEEDASTINPTGDGAQSQIGHATAEAGPTSSSSTPVKKELPDSESSTKTAPNDPPPLKHEESSCVPNADDNDFGETHEFDDADLHGFAGEELREMRFMREQALLEAAELEAAGAFDGEEVMEDFIDDGTADQCCPMCHGSIVGLSSDEASRHVNLCIDGNAPPLIKDEPLSAAVVATSAMRVKPDPSDAIPPAPRVDSVDISKRFSKSAVPRPAQTNPLEGSSSSNGAPRSAFSKLMSNNAEDTAWAAAAATEKASRGRPAYERTCPFYKIMPGFSICVDAFRYGAIEGCQAYFLSHFHSDHYIGLTARWTHGPIYCSKVTGSLVRKQLGTAGKWVVAIDFDRSYEIPGTDGATVTMIPANHCPGSSLFLFEKKMAIGSNSRMKRILHCGDFRACPAHVEHPLLRPELTDAVSGKVRQQKIDICYLDTTYLNPRYSFPPQDDVIQACADLCANMSADPKCKDDVWERSAKALGTPAVSKYFNTVNAKTEEQEKNPPKQRLLVICGTYSIGKERICLAIAQALDSKIFVSPVKMKICKHLDIPELTERLTSDPIEAQVHMQMLMEIRAETLQEYLNGYKPHFSRIVGFRPSGWNFRPTNSKAIGANTPPSTIPSEQILHSTGWRTRFGYKDFVAQRGSTSEAMCFGVPYSEHSSFRELALFVMSLGIEKVIPTVNVGSEQSRTRMKAWIDRWISERRRCGLVNPVVEGRDPDIIQGEMWDAKPGKGGRVLW
ncbi:DNA cross-link repair protein-like protein [Emericellopsis cladophorae]|uniref:DNA cross-link repair protein-like protein n=1 Tax=Emericellopsis cladophorae TaxID=2686198 RepID=A0A9Q0BG98_9HYPO|nr:DNA cross-link repair protein-like protein [Emericellopsis cladophorae]KAI6783756.1 DNA cross-link repair protein-like protein [Emericellopsis cladophorae]